MVMSWLLHSMQSEISQTYLFLSTAKEIWYAISQTYSKIGITAQIYELKCQIHATKQGSWSITKYYNKLQSLWLELDHYQHIEMVVAEDTTRLKKIMEQERVFEFLAGLNPELDQVRVQKLGKEPLPSIREVYAYVIGEESHRDTLENSALATAGNFKSMGSKVEGRIQMIKIHFGVIIVTNQDIHVNLAGNSMASLS